MITTNTDIEKYCAAIFIGFLLFFGVFGSSVFAEQAKEGHSSLDTQAERQVIDDPPRHLDGDLVLPNEYRETEEEKNCITICERWGQDCVINPETGTRKCRRICKSLTQQCF